MQRNLSFWLVCVVTVLAGSAEAAEDRFAASDSRSFEGAAAQLRVEMASGRYATLSAEDKQAIGGDLDQMQRLLLTYGPAAKFNRPLAVRYFNAQEHLNGLLSGDLANRYQCSFSGADIRWPWRGVSCATYATMQWRTLYAGNPSDPASAVTIGPRER